jgi:hypothetical protein
MSFSGRTGKNPGLPAIPACLYWKLAAIPWTPKCMPARPASRSKAKKTTTTTRQLIPVKGLPSSAKSRSDSTPLAAKTPCPAVNQKGMKNPKKMGVSASSVFSAKRLRPVRSLTLARFDEEINRLDREYAEDRDILAYLRILRFLGRYLQVKGAGADSGSILLLMSLYDSLERIVLARGMAGNEKRDLLLEDIGKYRGWAGKADLKAGHEEPQDKAAGVPAAEKDPAPEMTAREALTCVMEEIRKLREEVSALRDELKTLKSGRAAVNDSAPHH